MQTFEIPQDRWQEFFNGFSEEYRNWDTTIETIGQDLGDQEEAEGAPLQGISFEPVGSEAGSMEIALGDSPDSFQAHHIERPKVVRVADTQPGQETDLEIESGDGLKIIVHVRPYPELTH